MNITNHAVERYAQRIQGQSNVTLSDLSQAEIDNIRQTLEAAIVDKNLLYSGMPFTTRDGNEVESDIYMDEAVVIIYDKDTNAIITVYDVDLGFDESLNKRYINAMKDKIDMIRTISSMQLSNYDQIISSYNEYIEDYEKSIQDAEERIGEYKRAVKKYQAQVDEAREEAENIKIARNEEIRQLVSTMIQKK